MNTVLVLDNYDSFTYNLVHYIEKITYITVEVFRNDQITIDKIKNYSKIILSPGPGLPNEAGILKPLIANYASTKSILGICLGHQAIAEVFGGSLFQLNEVYHGIATPVFITDSNEPLFKNIPKKIEAGRYHSWMVNKKNLPECFKITALDHNQQIMAISHKTYDVKGIQFHPESILTPYGQQIIKNWIEF